MSINPRSQPYRLDPPVDEKNLPQIVTNADEMFQILFEDIVALDTEVDTVIAAAAAASSAVSTPGPKGPPGKEGASGASSFKVPPGGNNTTFVPYVGAVKDVDLGPHSLTVDSPTFFVDSVNHRVGLGTIGPGYPLHVVGAQDLVTFTQPSTSGFTTLLLEAGTGHSVAHLYAFGAAYATSGRLIADSFLLEATQSAGLGLSAAAVGGLIKFYTEATLKATLHASGGFSLGDATDPGIGNLRVVGNITEDKSAIAAVSTDGIIVQNVTPSTAGVPVQQSPRIRFRSHVWNTTAVAADNTDDWLIESVPVSGLVPTGLLKFGKSLNGGTISFPATLSSAGALVTLGGITAGTSFAFADTGSISTPTRSAITVPGAAQFNFISQAVGNTGIGLDFATDGTLKIRGRAFTAGTGNIDIGAKATSYNGVVTTGWGVPAIYGTGRAIAQTAANASVAAYTVGAADGSFIVSANVNVTTSTLHNFTVTCSYTDETNTARVQTIPFVQLAGTPLTAITNATGAGPYESMPLHIRCKASTAITIGSTGAGGFTTVTYNIEGSITQIS